MIIRLRCRAGTWRVTGVNESTTLEDVKRRVEAEHKVPASRQVLTKTAGVGGAGGGGAGGAGGGAGAPLPDSATLGSLGLRHGDMLQLEYDAAIEAVSATGARVVSTDGKLVSTGGATASARAKKAFRPGLMSLRDMKMHWTLTEMTMMAAQYEFKMERQKTAWCKEVSMYGDAANNFQLYLRNFRFTRPCFAVLYGTASEEGEVKVEAVYEVPQTFSEDEGLAILDDEREEQVDKLAALLGLQRVGIMFSHAPRAKGFNFTADEVLTSAAYQMEAGEKSTFVTVKVTANDDGTTKMEAWQVSDQCVEMMSREALLVNPEDPKTTLIDETFTAIVEAKEAKTVDNDFFLVAVPIKMHDSEVFASASFPPANRETRPQVGEDIAEHLLEQRAAPDAAKLADFHLLLFATGRVFDLDADMPTICSAVLNKGEIQEGHMLMLKSLAGMLD